MGIFSFYDLFETLQLKPREQQNSNLNLKSKSVLFIQICIQDLKDWKCENQIDWMLINNFFS